MSVKCLDFGANCNKCIVIPVFSDADVTPAEVEGTSLSWNLEPHMFEMIVLLAHSQRVEECVLYHDMFCTALKPSVSRGNSEDHTNALNQVSPTFSSRRAAHTF